MSDPDNSDKDKKSGNIFDDNFFDALNEIDDGLDNIAFQKVGSENHESIQDVLSDKNLLPDQKTEKTKDIKLNSKALPVSKLPQAKVKETEDMNNKAKFDPLDLPNDDPASTQMKEIWESMNTPDASEFKLMVLRLEPAVIKGMKISGYLETFHLPTTIPDIIEQIGQKYGGGRYQIRIVDGAGKYVKSKSFEISGLPKIPSPENKVNEENVNQAAQNTSPSPQVSTPTSTTTNNDKKETENSSDDADSDDDDDWDTDYEFDPTPRRRLRPIGHSYQAPYSDPYRSDTPYNAPYTRPSPFRSDNKDNKEVKEVEEKVNKLESKLDKIVDLFQGGNNKNNGGKGLFDPDIVKALAPVVVTWLDSKGAKETSSVGQFSEMNKQIVGLMQGMQDLVRVSDKSKEDFAEKERKEREQSRREMLEYQAQMEQRFLAQSQRAEERNQTMMLQMKEALESKHREAIEGEQRTRIEYEKLRQEFREKEERAREETRLREEKLREEARIRDEEARRREFEFREKARQDEIKWREELRLREEETRRREAEREELARRREIEWKEELRQKEIAALNDSKLRELEIMKQMREMDQTKTGMQQKLIEQIYTSNNSNRESQLQMELAIAKMTSDNEARMLQANAEMQLEKIRHATQMQMAKMKHDLSSIENKRSEDPLDSAMQDYLKRKLQIDMIKELNMDVDEGDLPNNSFMNTLKKLAEGAGPLLMQILAGGGLGGNQRPMMPNPGNVRSVNPTVSVPNNQPVDDEDIDMDDDSDDEEEDLSDESSETEDAAEENVSQGPDLSGIDPAQEIPRVSEFFKYLRASIEGGVVTPVEAAKEAKSRLSPLIVEFLSTVKNSRTVIEQLYPLLHSMGQEFAGFFTQPTTLEWMDKMLSHMNDSEEKASTKNDVITSKIEDKATAPEVKSETADKVEVKEEPKGRKKRQKANNVQ